MVQLKFDDYIFNKNGDQFNLNELIKNSKNFDFKFNEKVNYYYFYFLDIASCKCYCKWWILGLFIFTVN